MLFCLLVPRFHFSKNFPVVKSAYKEPSNLKSMSLMSLSLGDDALDVGNGLVEDLLEGLGVLELLANLGNDGVGELLLLAGLDGTLVADPRVEDGLGLVGEVDLLLELVSLGLELGGFLAQQCQYV